MTSKKTEVAVLLSTCPPEDAERLAGFLVEHRHAACVNVLPEVRSVYRWESELQCDSESLLVIKCAAANVGAVTNALVREHPADVPEVVAFDVVGGHPEYLAWVLESTSSP